MAEQLNFRICDHVVYFNKNSTSSKEIIPNSGDLNLYVTFPYMYLKSDFIIGSSYYKHMGVDLYIFMSSSIYDDSHSSLSSIKNNTHVKKMLF